MEEPSRKPLVRPLAALGIAVGLAGSARGQWTAVSLHPSESFFSSELNAVTPTQQFGTAAPAPQGVFLPGYWNGSASSWTALGASGVVMAAFGDEWTGWANGVGVMWEGPSHTPYVAQAPPGYVGADVFATTGLMQAGGVGDGHRSRAAVWHGPTSIATVLDPPGAYDSLATAADGEYQGGWVRYPNSGGAPGIEHAVIWHGTAQSMIDLGTGSNGALIRGMAAGQLVGIVGSGQGSIAALWPSIGASYINLNPPGVTYADLTATCGSAQVGSASTNEFGGTAAIWFGTPGSFVPLAPYLPPNYYASIATSVAELNGTFYVGGYAVNSITSFEEAILWVGVPEPASALVLGAGLWLRRRRRA